MKRLGLAMACAGALVVMATDARAVTSADQESRQPESDKVRELDAVKVTAERREEDLQKTSISITSVSGDEISQQGLANIQDIVKNVPSVVVTATGRGQTVAIRGLGFDLPPQTGENPVSLNFDGIYNFRAESGTFGFYDLEQIDVLRGPQGTLYGRNATAGVVNVISKAPSQEFEARGALEVGNYNLLRVEGALNVPLSDNWAVRVASVSINRDGYLDNGQDDAVGTSSRVRALYKPSDVFSLMLNAEYSKIGGHGRGFVSIPDFEAGNPSVGLDPESASNHYTSTRFWGQLDANLGPGVLTVIPSYQDASGYNYARRTTCPDVVCRGDDPTAAEQQSLEVRYANASGSDIKWVGGLYYYDMSNLTVGYYTGLFSKATTTSYSAFGQVTYPLTSSVNLIGGIRLTSDNKGFRDDTRGGVETSGDETRSAFDWKAGLEYNPNATSMLYASLASAHRPGGFNTFAAVTDPAFGSFYDAESLISLELGSKNRFFDNRLQINGSVFYYDYSDYQAADIFVDQGTRNLVATFLNVDKVSNYGAELELQALAGNGGMFNLGLTWLRARYDSDFVLTNTLLGPAQMDGRQLPHAPDLSVKGGYEHTFFLGDAGWLTARIQARYTDDQWINLYPSQANFQGSYVTGDLSLTFASAKNWSLNAYLKNVNDKVVKVTASEGYGVTWPRTWGMVFSVSY